VHQKKNLQIYPNPAVNQTWINIRSQDLENAHSYPLYNQAGQLAAQGIVENKKSRCRL
jgi:hypothetical protein